MSEKQIVTVAAVVLQRVDTLEVLVLLRKKNPGAGMIGLPAGKLDWGEPLAACARRELQEEAGILLSAGQFSASPIVLDEVWTEHDVHSIIHYYFAVVDKDIAERILVMEPEKHEWLKWVHVSALKNSNVTLGATIIPSDLTAITRFTTFYGAR